MRCLLALLAWRTTARYVVSMFSVCDRNILEYVQAGVFEVCEGIEGSKHPTCNGCRSRVSCGPESGKHNYINLAALQILKARTKTKTLHTYRLGRGEGGGTWRQGGYINLAVLGLPKDGGGSKCPHHPWR